MARRTIILLSIFSLTNHVHSQFYDLFSSYQPYNLQTARPNIYPQEFLENRPLFEGFIRNDSDEERRPPSITNDRREPSRSTTKSRRKSTTTAQIFNLNFFTTPKPVRKHKNSSHRNSSNKNKNQSLLLNNNKRPFYDDSSNNVADYKPNLVTEKPVFAINRPTANSRPNNINNKPNYEPKIEYDDNRSEYNLFTTHNPLYHRPGVKPAPVDPNQPPITNKPATVRPDFPRPDTQRPEVARPVNRRPEVARPITIKPATTRPFAVYPKPTDSSAIRYPVEKDTSPEVVVGADEDKMSSAEKRRYIDLAERMCDKYKALNVKKVEAIPLLPSPQPVQVNVTTCSPTKIPLVVGGRVVTIEEFPHMALLGWTRLQGGGYSWKCGGSLISDQFVLTAGHCAYQEKDDTVVIGAPRVVQLGSSTLDDTGALVMKVLSVVTHPKYVMTRSYYDIALVKMVRPVTFSQVVKPACLGVPPGVGEPIIASGWGRTEFGGTQSEELRSVSVPIWDISECGRVLGTSRKLPNGPSSDSQVCAGEKQGGKDTCQGDSGGPAQIQDGCVWRVVAVTSLGRSCGAPNTPALYATLHRAFIAAQVFGKAPDTTNHNSDRNENNNNPRPPVNNNWNNNNNRENTNNNRTPRPPVGNNNDNRENTNNNQAWNTNQQNSNHNGNDGLISNQNWGNSQTTNKFNNPDWNANNNDYTNNNQNSQNNGGYSIVTDSSNYGNNNRQQFNNDRLVNNDYNVNNDHKIVYPEVSGYNQGNINNNNNYGINSYTTHRPSQNGGWWSGYDY
ncbi:uncharacterized protein LOC135085338 [Ostrinia nubilalis]|uniref:uncharacterized protein LOC135085338 n=1 Tax=Ostrinia nubilalis TaxID=29057 RepID=UPI0030823A4E